MPPPAEPALIEIAGLTKQHAGLRPLRITRLHVRAGDRILLHGFDAAAAEIFVHLVTGYVLPDQGQVLVNGRETREITSESDWLASLDRFGLVTARAVLLDSLPLGANLALPFTLSIDPMPEEVRGRVECLAVEVGLGPDQLGQLVSTLSPAQRVRVHLARALAPDPRVLLLEHPTASLEPADAAALGHTLASIAEARRVTWIALTEDEAFAKAAGGTRYRLEPGSGIVRATRRPWRLWN